MPFLAVPLFILGTLAAHFAACGLSAVWSAGPFTSHFIAGALYLARLLPEARRHSALCPVAWMVCLLLCSTGLHGQHTTGHAFIAALVLNGLCLLIGYSLWRPSAGRQWFIPKAHPVPLLAQAQGWFRRQFDHSPAVPPRSGSSTELSQAVSRAAPLSPDLADAAEAVRIMADPARLEPTWRWPWSAESSDRRQTRELSRQARLDQYKDHLRAFRTANEALGNAAAARASAASETSIFEAQCLNEMARFGIVNRVQHDMTSAFLDRLAAVESFRGRVSTEILDALRERALNEFAGSMNRASSSNKPASESVEKKK